MMGSKQFISDTFSLLPLYSSSISIQQTHLTEPVTDPTSYTQWLTEYFVINQNRDRVEIASKYRTRRIF